jgi:hypothetical protein
VSPETRELVTWAAGGIGSLVVTGGGALLRAIWTELRGMKAAHAEQHEETKTALSQTTTSLAVINTALTGIRGDNGLVGDVEKLKNDVERHSRQLAGMVPRRREGDAA